ncbi:cbb3-type cytochrome oxidase subunit 1 [Actinomycetospora corticicola]|uniref:Cbb3-type cytochrome oxidase subunit 1 n=1 Tax=Actinomycetospora corticicola TaxID=663602 RepID=A0A7Y9DYQ7_9PSEU|nr:cbb3-type cytochrome oxidase subunit 1 [Actinomycetospora corticicola]
MLAILGFVIKGLFWLAIVGIVLFVATAILGGVKRSSLRR